MASLYRLSTRARQEIEEAKVSADELAVEIVRSAADGVITPQEIRAIMDRLDRVNREVREALVAVAEADVVEAVNTFRSKAGLDAPLNFYLKEKVQDLSRLKQELAAPAPTYAHAHAIPAQAGGTGIGGGKKRTGLTLIKQASGSTRLVRRG